MHVPQEVPGQGLTASAPRLKLPAGMELPLYNRLRADGSYCVTRGGIRLSHRQTGADNERPTFQRKSPGRAADYHCGTGGNYVGKHDTVSRNTGVASLEKCLTDSSPYRGRS